MKKQAKARRLLLSAEKIRDLSPDELAKIDGAGAAKMQPDCSGFCSLISGNPTH